MSITFCSDMIIKYGEQLIEHKKGDTIDISSYPDIPVIVSRNGKLSAISHIKYIHSYAFYTEPIYPQYLQGWLNVYLNQYDAGKQICTKFRGGIRNVILAAQMQSGKTGVAKYVVHNMSHCSPVMATMKTCYLVCGMNDNDLRKQAIFEFAGLIPEEHILFSKQLQRINHNNISINADLIIIDESHYGSLVGSQLDKFMGRLEGNPYILSVSATPMAELASSTALGKPYVYLQPSKGYYGMKDIFTRDLIFQSVNINRNENGFLDILEDEYTIQRNDEWKYNIIRLPHQWYFKDMEEAISDVLDVDFINHHNEYQTHGCVKTVDFNSYIQSPPKKMTIIWVYNSLRAGKQLNTANIGFVYDTSDTGPDTISQSLLGRIMGYGKAVHGVRCYTDVKSAEKMLAWINTMYSTLYIPQNSRNIINGYCANRIYSWRLHPPILVELPKPLQAYYSDLKTRYKNRYPYKDEFLNDLVNVCNEEDADILDEIFNTYKPGQRCGLMILNECNKPQSYDERWVQNHKAWKDKIPVRGFDADEKGNFYYVFANFHCMSMDYGKVLITYKEYINSDRLADYVSVTKKSMYGLPS